MTWTALLQALFGKRHQVERLGDLLVGTGWLDESAIAVVGTTDHAAVGVELALAQSRAVLDVVRDHPGRPLLLLVDTQGQRLRHRDELLGIHRCMAHLASCVELARCCGHRTIGLVYDRALSGGFLSTGMMADACYALPDAEIRVMRLQAMARVTKIPEDRLAALACGNPVFAPGVDNYVAMGGIRGVWRGDLAACLREALRDSPREDRRAADGAARGGRSLACSVASRIGEG